MSENAVFEKFWALRIFGNVALWLVFTQRCVEAFDSLAEAGCLIYLKESDRGTK